MQITRDTYSKPSCSRWTTFVVRDDQAGCVYLRELIEGQMGAIFLKISGFYSIQKAHQYARSIRAEYRNKNAAQMLDILTSKIGISTGKKSRKKVR
ncbi:hypothetical protein [Laspinema olomoucense]|uniref:hypothetical protein n=1 Tax=Laspinema olomoucense TaxID=3231600 RepID=UPI0021BA4C41|nr:hypothetical protein [Laspinema sp. D3a]MCT7989025.1 hypothetical protein [Laspinema sp. D3a]